MDFWPRLKDDETAEMYLYSGHDKKITVPHIIAGYVTKAIARWAFSGYGRGSVQITYVREPFIEDITVEEGYEELHHGAFYTLSSLKRLSLPSTLKTIYGDPFETCDSLKEIVFPNGNKYFKFENGKLMSADNKTVYFTVREN